MREEEGHTQPFLPATRKETAPGDCRPEPDFPAPPGPRVCAATVTPINSSCLLCLWFQQQCAAVTTAAKGTHNINLVRTGPGDMYRKLDESDYDGHVHAPKSKEFCLHSSQPCTTVTASSPAQVVFSQLKPIACFPPCWVVMSAPAGAYINCNGAIILLLEYLYQGDEVVLH